jgi:hypothetical protein
LGEIIFKNLSIFENNIISVELAKVLGYLNLLMCQNQEGPEGPEVLFKRKNLSKP